MSKRIIDPKKIATKDLHQFMLGCIAPRPIAFVSTKNKEGEDNLAPYSFFNAFSSNPPIAVFSSNRRVRDNTTKDTLQNVLDQKECVINMVNYDIVNQMALTSVEYPDGVSEFVKAGLTPIRGETVDVNMVAESPANLECKVMEVLPLGEHGGAGHLIICEITRLHINESVLDNDRIDPHKMDLMGRMGRAFYVRASGDAVQTIYQSVTDIPLGYDAIPNSIKMSNEFTAHQISELARAVPKEELVNDLEVNANIAVSKVKELVHQKSYQIAASIIKYME